MTRDQIATAQALFYERDRVQKKLDVVAGKGGVAVAITGDYQGEEVVLSIKPSLIHHFECELGRIDEQLTALGWTER